MRHTLKAFTISLVFHILYIWSCALDASENLPQEYIQLYNEGKYAKALEVVNSKLQEIYLTRVDDKRIPTDYITTQEDQSKVVGKIETLKKMFRERKSNIFFIEENKDLATLHLYAARANYKLDQYNYSLSHYIQCLRFKTIQYNSDDIILYEIAQVYKKSGYIQAYHEALETAYSLNMENGQYSLELGLSLSHTKDKKRAIFHLERYLNLGTPEANPQIFLILANLNEDLSKYLDTEKYYIKYLSLEPKNGAIQFALGYTAFSHTGNLDLAQRAFLSSLDLIPESSILIRSRANEYLGDIAFRNMKFRDAVNFYKQTMHYQASIQSQMDDIGKQIQILSETINKLKSSLLIEQDFMKYSEYLKLMEKKGKMELEMKKIQNDYNKIHNGKVHWFIAESFERLGQLNDAISSYEQAIQMNYKSNLARDKIIKLQLKINRGF